MLSAYSQDLKNYMQEYANTWPFSGTILIARQGEILLREAYEYASVEHEIPTAADTRFRI